MNELKLFFGTLIFFSMFYMSLNSLYSTDIIREYCYITQNNNICSLELVSRKNCLSDLMHDYECEKYGKMQIIPCFVRLDKYFNLCKLYSDKRRIFEDITNVNYIDLF